MSCGAAAEGNKPDQAELPHFSLDEGPKAVNASWGIFVFKCMCFAFLWIVMDIILITSQSVLALSIGLTPSVCILG